MRYVGNCGAQSNRDFGSSSTSGSSFSSSYTDHKHGDIDKGDRNSMSSRSDKSFRYDECEGFGNYEAKCPTCIKRKKKSFTITLSDEESSSDNDREEYGRTFISCSQRRRRGH